MSNAANAFGLYLVMTDPVAGYAKCTEAAVRADVRYVQLRMKHAQRDDIVACAREAASITRGTGTLFIVNDDPSIAVEIGADGVHLGQDDMRPSEVRRLYPELGIIGLSTHSMEQAMAASAEAPAYIGVGPVYATPTKEKPDPVLGPEEAGRIIRTTAMPAVALGGVDETTLPQVLTAGAVNFAVVRAVCASSVPFDAIRRLQDIWRCHISL